MVRWDRMGVGVALALLVALAVELMLWVCMGTSIVRGNLDRGGLEGEGPGGWWSYNRSLVSSGYEILSVITDLGIFSS